ncbi:response regulator [Pseudanabaena sp. PCC 6802]|uniref:response regulator n=1 Tax=Pseudanabaena sp. PCC 6802 TaxID=118173 RepID=UPI000346BFBB|nr:response regulator [Pseudanabaena sp. PCC 6802]
MPDTAILCVDDEETILMALKQQLKNCFGSQYIYEVAQSAEEAWLAIDDLVQDRIEIIIVVSDWLMPNVRGDEFLIQVHQRFPEVKTIMLTGQADEAAINRARKQANLYACISKPWQQEELQQIIYAALN